MSRQVKTPRFYVDMPTFLHATGQRGWDDEKGGVKLLYMNPSNPHLTEVATAQELTAFLIGSADNNNPKTSFPINFVALLNHNLGSNTNEFRVVGKHGLSSATSVDLYPSAQILNANHATEYISPEWNGTTIFKFTSDDQFWRSFGIYYDGSNYIDAGTHQLGSFVVGKYWDAPNSPDLNLTMSRRFEGIKRQKTINGKILANTYYDGSTEWTMNGADGIYKYPAFELDLTGSSLENQDLYAYRAKSGLGRKGLRSWKLTFSYIGESDMWIDNEVSNTLTSDDVTPNNDIPNPMLSDNSFNFVWNCTLGGTLPFIFQPDNTNNNPDQFSICTFRGNSLSVKQVAHNTYSLSITIDEVA